MNRLECSPFYDLKFAEPKDTEHNIAGLRMITMLRSLDMEVSTKKRRPGKGAPLASKSSSKHDQPPRVTKRSVLVTMLQRPQGATIEDICAALDWKRPAVVGYLQFLIWVTSTGVRTISRHYTEDGGCVYKAA